MTELKYMSIKELKSLIKIHLFPYAHITEEDYNSVINVLYELINRVQAPFNRPPKALIYKWEKEMEHNKIHTELSDQEFDMAYALIKKLMERKNKDFNIKVTIMIEQK